jgi:hypothetical protein
MGIEPLEQSAADQVKNQLLKFEKLLETAYKRGYRDGMFAMSRNVAITPSEFASTPSTAGPLMHLKRKP